MNIENLLRFNTFESWFGFLYAKIDMLLFLKCVKVRRSSLKIYFMIRSSLDIICYSRDIEMNEMLPNGLIFSTGLYEISLLSNQSYTYNQT